MLIGLLQSLLLITLNRHNLIGALLAIETILILSYSIAAKQGSASNMTEATGLVILAVSIGAIEAAIGLAISAVYRNLRTNLNLSLQTLLIAKPSTTLDNHLRSVYTSRPILAAPTRKASRSTRLGNVGHQKHHLTAQIHTHQPNSVGNNHQ